MFIVMETQTNTDGSVGVISTTYADEDEAQSKYHTILSFAAISSLPKHAAFLLTDDATIVESRVYYHEPEPTEATE